MKEKKFFDLLCCPACKGDLEWANMKTDLHCPSCKYDYPIIDGIPVLFPCNVKQKMDELFGRYWDSEEKADLYNEKVEGEQDIFGQYNHESELYALTCFYNKQNLDIILDAGCGNGRFFETFSPNTVKIGIDASLNLLKIVRRQKRTDFLVCGELENLPFKNGIFSTVISCRVLQHLHEQEKAYREMYRVTRDRGDIILELYNSLNLKTIYKNIRMSPLLRRFFNAPFRMLFRSMSPFRDWGLSYDRYNNWFAVKRWMKRTNLKCIDGRGAGFGYHKYFFDPFYIHVMLNKKAPGLLKHYYDTCFLVEKAVGGLIPIRYFMEKIVIRGIKNAPKVQTGMANKVVNKLRHIYKSSDFYNSAALRETKREVDKSGIFIKDNRFHVLEAIEWLKRAQDATPDSGVARGYSVGWTPHLNSRGWQLSYPETTGYIIPTMFDCAAFLKEEELRIRAIEMADWEINIQMDSGAVMGGVITPQPTPAVFNTGQVMLGWLRTFQETKEQKYLKASKMAADFLVRIQSPDGAWYSGNSQFAKDSTTYNTRVGWSIIMHGKQTGNNIYIEAGKRNIAYTISQQNKNGWFKNNCLSDPTKPLLHTICYAIEGLLGSYRELGYDEYLQHVRLAVENLVEQVDKDGNISGRFDCDWNGAVQWNCLTGSAQLAGILLVLYDITQESRYQTVARKVLKFLKSTQNCVSDDSGLRGGIKGSYPFDGDYGRFELLNWPTKFYIDALILNEKFS